ncbi:MAG: TonB-dependent receptor [Telluria sp.]
MNLTNKRAARTVPGSIAFKLSPVAAGCAVFMALAGQVAYAQDATVPQGTAGDIQTTGVDANGNPIQRVQVSGIRRGIEDAISVKKNATSIVEAISAEDIGKLPDTTIAESLARLPGLTTQRTKDGNASTVSIRGLGPDFSGYLLNGREQTSTGDSRAVDLSVYPAELIAGATVYKTADAGVVGNGLAGTIDQQLIDPLAFGKRTIAIKGQKFKTGLGLDVQGKGNRESLTYIDQFFGRTVGVAIGFVRQVGTSSQNEFGTWGDYTGPVGTSSGIVNAKVPGGNGYNIDTRHVSDERKGVAAILAYKPNRDFSSQVDVFWSKINDYTKIDQLQIPGTGNFINTTVAGGVASSTTMTNVGLIDRNEGILDHDTLKSIGWKNTLKLNDSWSAMVDFSHNNATRVERDNEYYAGTPNNANLTFNNLGGSVPQLSYGSSLTDQNNVAVRNQCGWSGIANNSACGSIPQAGYAKGPTVSDQVNAIRAEAKYDIPEGSAFTRLRFGVNYTNRTKDRVTDEGLIISSAEGGYARVPFPAGSYVANNVGGTGLAMLAFDPQVDLIPGTTLLRKYANDILSKSYGVQEKLTTLYGKVDIDSHLGQIPMTGNIGMQVVHTNQSATGFQANVGSSPVLNNPVAGGMSRDTDTYNDFLPSLNLNFDLGNSYVGRFGLSKQVARPNMTDLRNSFSFSLNTTPTAVNGVTPPPRFEGSAGNPHLKPFRDDALDLSLEKYFAKKGYVSAALFYKKLDSYIVPQSNTSFDYSPYLSSFGLASLPGGNKGIYTSTVNGNGGNLKGMELTASAPFELIHPVLNGFGATGSYSATLSSVQLPNIIGLNPDQAPNAGSIPLPGLSKTNAKAMIYFEKWGFSAFVAENYRSRYVGSVANDTVGGFPSLVYIESQKWLSAQIGYEVQTGALKGLQVRVEANNLNSPSYVETNADGSNKSRTQTGRTIFFTLGYKM